jgi:hypothetical protein
MLQLAGPQEFTIQLRDEGPYLLQSAGSPCKFQAPASTRGVAKLYTLSDGPILMYVGIAEQPMSARLGYGFRANGKGGYHGYKWKGLRHALKLTVWTGSTPTAQATLRELETVEAEVAFLCRQASGQWPQYQHEIHFYPSTEHHRAAAQVVYMRAIAGEA